MKDYKRLTTLVYISEDGKSKDYLCDASVRATNIRLGELEDKIENGTLIELPCKIGDTLWFDNYKNGKSIGIKGRKVKRIDIEFNVETEYYIGCDLPIEQINKTIFLSKAEAEQKLKEIKGEKE